MLAVCTSSPGQCLANEMHSQAGRMNDAQDGVGQGQNALGMQVLLEERFDEACS